MLDNVPESPFLYDRNRCCADGVIFLTIPCNEESRAKMFGCCLGFCRVFVGLATLRLC